jgi:hypothetical protein
VHASGVAAGDTVFPDNWVCGRNSGLHVVKHAANVLDFAKGQVVNVHLLLLASDGK